MKLLLCTILIAATLLAQPTQLSIQGPAPLPPQDAGGQAVGLRGGSTLYYWIIARFPTGTAATAVMVPNTVGPAELSVANYVNLTWTAATGATGYDVLRSTTSTYPAPCANCAVVTNTALTAIQDTGAALTSYPPVGVNPAPTVIADITVDNRTDTRPFLTADLAGQRRRIALAPVTPPTTGNCVEWVANGQIGDAGAACGTGSGSGGTVEGLCIPSISAGNGLISPPCQVRLGNADMTFPSTATFDATSGTGIAFIGVQAGQLKVWHNVVASCTNATCLSGYSAPPADAFVLARFTVTAGAVTATTDLRLMQSSVRFVSTPSVTISEDPSTGEFSAAATPTTQMSIESDGLGLRLKGDSAAPGANKVYGTDSGGNLGFKPDPAGGSATGVPTNRILMQDNFCAVDGATAAPQYGTWRFGAFSLAGGIVVMGETPNSTLINPRFPCGMALRSGATSGNRTGLTTGNQFFGRVYRNMGSTMPANTTWARGFYVSVSSLTNARYYFGGGNASNIGATNTPGGDALIVRLSTIGVTDTTFKLLTVNGGSLTTTASTVTISANTVYQVVLYSTTAGTVCIQVNGETAQCTSSNVTNNLMNDILISETGENVDKYLHIHEMSMAVDMTGTRY